MGTGPFAVPSFEAMRAAGHLIELVVTKPQPPVKSRKGTPPSPVRDWATTHALPLFDPVSINDAQSLETVGAVGADLLVVCDYGQILKPMALAAARLGGINLHGSLLPAYRGAAPVQRALLSGDAQTGVSVIHMTPQLDGGPILVTRSTAIGDDETAGQLEERLAQIGVAATLESLTLLSRWDGSSPLGTSQDPAKVSKAPRLHKSEGEIDWSRSAREISCHVRGMQPWPIAFTHVKVRDNKPPVRLAVKEIELTRCGSGGHDPGELVQGDGFLVATGDNVIRITRLQPAGKKEMPGEDFLRGHQLHAGVKLCSAS
ncbi:MAG: methionyl-tRNA formyltransferase [Pirellulales bacterium]|nr:methionyl-tRNA formyltransferase [Pirellulales bacterium]